jgi:hypothetical protein
VNDELERIWKVAVVAYAKKYLGICLTEMTEALSEVTRRAGGGMMVGNELGRTRKEVVMA